MTEYLERFQKLMNSVDNAAMGCRTVSAEQLNQLQLYVTHRRLVGVLDYEYPKNKKVLTGSEDWEMRKKILNEILATILRLIQHRIKMVIEDTSDELVPLGIGGLNYLYKKISQDIAQTRRIEFASKIPMTAVPY